MVVDLADLRIENPEAVLGRKLQVEENPRLARLAAAGRGRKFGADAVVVEGHAVVADRGGLALVGEARAIALVGVVLWAGLGLQLAGRRHHEQAAHRPGVEVAEACDVVDAIVVAGFPTLSLIVRAEFDHPERHRRPGVEHPARVGRAQHRVHVVHGLAFRRGALDQPLGGDHLPAAPQFDHDWPRGIGRW